MPAPDPTAALPQKMKAIVQPAYGLPEVLVHTEVDRPTPDDDGVLLQVVAASLHKGDWHLLTGTPYLVRMLFGLTRPKHPIPGMAVAGRVAAVGSRVTKWKVGDEVFGEISGGGFAEYVVVRADELARRPASLTLEEVATLPVSATTALQGLRDAGRLKAGQSVLINGAAGGVGLFAVQIARALGAGVTGVCSAGNLELVRATGADDVVDYAAQDFTRGERRYDVILDLVGNHGTSALRGALAPQGLLVACAGGAQNNWVGPLVNTLSGLLSNLWSAQKFVPLMARPATADLDAVGALADAGALRPFIDRRYRLIEVPEALRQLGQGHSRGKSVITP